jgi:hypothetical protein
MLLIAHDMAVGRPASVDRTPGYPSVDSSARTFAAVDHRPQLAERHLARQVLHAAVRRCLQPFGRHVPQNLADAVGDPVLPPHRSGVTELAGHFAGTADPADHLYSALLRRQVTTPRL